MGWPGFKLIDIIFHFFWLTDSLSLLSLYLLVEFVDCRMSMNWLNMDILNVDVPAFSGKCITVPVDAESLMPVRETTTVEYIALLYICGTHILSHLAYHSNRLLRHMPSWHCLTLGWLAYLLEEHAMLGYIDAL